MRKTHYLAIGAIALLCTACHPEQQPIRDLGTLTERLVKSDTWSAADWDDALLYYNEIDQALNQYEYSEQERNRIDSLQTVCKGAFLSHDWGEDVPVDMLNAFIMSGLY